MALSSTLALASTATLAIAALDWAGGGWTSSESLVGLMTLLKLYQQKLIYGNLLVKAIRYQAPDDEIAELRQQLQRVDEEIRQWRDSNR